MKTLLRPALAFVAIGLALYLLAFAGAEALLQRTGRSHPLFKVQHLREPEVDWLVLGASHAMPLDFADVGEGLQRTSGRRIVNLAAQGAGPLYNRFVLDAFLREHRARQLLYVVDSFAFDSRAWNEDRFADAKLLRRTPFQLPTLRMLARYAYEEGVDPRTVLDFASGFSKINNRERFARDIWEGESQFERAARPSSSAVKRRIEYLYPQPTDPAARDRAMGQFDALLAQASASGMQLRVAKLPLPRAFRTRLPDEAAFDARLLDVLRRRGARWHDWSALVDETDAYFDTDHLNRKGVGLLVERGLGALLEGARTP